MRYWSEENARTFFRSNGLLRPAEATAPCPQAGLLGIWTQAEKVEGETNVDPAEEPDWLTQAAQLVVVR